MIMAAGWSHACGQGWRLVVRIWWPATHVDHLRASLRLAHEDGVIPSVPRLRRPKVEKKTPVFLTPEQTVQLLTTLRGREAGTRRGGLGYGAVYLAVSLGLRPGEVVTRRWEDLDWTEEVLRVAPVTLPDGTQWRPKSDSARTLPLTSDILLFFKELWLSVGRPATGWIFPNRNRPEWPMNNFKKGLAGACEAAGIPVLHPHALRHTAATRWTRGGVDVPTIMGLGGWKTPSVPLQVYAQTTEDWKREAVVNTQVFVDQKPLTNRIGKNVGLSKSGLESKSGRPDSNRRPSAPKADALPG